MGYCGILSRFIQIQHIFVFKQLRGIISLEADAETLVRVIGFLLENLRSINSFQGEVVLTLKSTSSEVNTNLEMSNEWSNKY